MKLFATIALWVILATIAAWLLGVIVFRPSHHRAWEMGQERLPHITIDGDVVTVTDYRDFLWREDGTINIRYTTQHFSLSAMESVDVFISHFDDFEGLAHIFLSFGFANGQHAVVSLETRREEDETFSPTRGVLRQYEIIYVVGSEKDIVGLRTDVRGERVYLYPTVATAAQAQKLFRLLAEDINHVYEKPRMYNTLTHNCTNELTRRVEEMSDVQFPLTWKTLLPGYFDEVLYEMGLIAHAEDFTGTKSAHHIDNARVDCRTQTYSQDLRVVVSCKDGTAGC